MKQNSNQIDQKFNLRFNKRLKEKYSIRIEEDYYLLNIIENI